jgi:hypothetical protein
MLDSTPASETVSGGPHNGIGLEDPFLSPGGEVYRGFKVWLRIALDI